MTNNCAMCAIPISTWPGYDLVLCIPCANRLFQVGGLNWDSPWVRRNEDEGKFPFMIKSKMNDILMAHPELRSEAFCPQCGGIHR